MKALVAALATILAAQGVWAANLSNPQSPSAYFRQNEAARAEFIESVNESALSEDLKAAYRALVEPSLAEMAGDEVLEAIDEETLAWFYSGQMGEPEMLHKTALISRDFLNREDCKSYALCVWVSKSQQTLHAYQNGRAIQGLYGVPVSTARPGKWTPTGTFTVGELAGPNRVSGRYSGAALYYAMQLDGHIFIHATSKDNYGALGTPASAGCIRTQFVVAEQLNLLMREIAGRSKGGVMANTDKVRVVVID